MACVVALGVTGMAGVIWGPVYPDVEPICCTNVVLPLCVTEYIPDGVITVSARAVAMANKPPSIIDNMNNVERMLLSFFVVSMGVPKKNGELLVPHFILNYLGHIQVTYHMDCVFS